MSIRLMFIHGAMLAVALSLFACAPTATSSKSDNALQRSASSPDGTAHTVAFDTATLEEMQRELATAESTVTTVEEVDASSYGVVGDGVTDNSVAFRRLLAGGNRTIHVRAGDYLTDSLHIEANTVLALEPGVILRDLGTLAAKERLLNIRSTHHVRIIGWGAQLLADRTHYTTGEQRHGVLIIGSDHVTIEGLESSGHGGDGFYIGGPTGAPSTDIVLRGCKAGNNRRQGLSITSARRVHVVDCEFTDTNGTAPEFGIDLEPNYPTDLLDDINFLRVATVGNRGGGIAVFLHNFDATSAHAVINIAEHRSASEFPVLRTEVEPGTAATIRYRRADE
jgi:hypothetical protein